jgi:uncharacterized protein YjeT (DUF2065 family)
LKGLENLLSSNTKQNLLLQSIGHFFNCIDYVTPSEIIEDDEAEGTWKEAVSTHLKVPGTWKEAVNTHLKVPGTWKEAVSTHLKAPGTWKEAVSTHLKAPGTWKEAVNTHLKAPCHHLRSGAKNHERFKSIAGLSTKN